MANSNEPGFWSRYRFPKSSGFALSTLDLSESGYAVLGNWSAKTATKRVEAMEPVAPVNITTDTGIRVHGIQSGWIGIKTRHYHMRGPEALKELSILTDTRWTEPKPILSWIIEHPEGLIVIDSGERAGAVDLPTYFACTDVGSQYFISRNFRVNVESESELGPQLVKLGLSPADVRRCIQTHLHFDHADGFRFLPRAEILVSKTELEGHRNRPLGAVTCKYPPNFDPTALDYTAGTYSSFTRHYPLTRAGDVVIVPTPGHSYGHQSVILSSGRQTLFFAGDVVYDERQLLEDEVSGINVGVSQTKETMAITRAHLASTPTVFLPSHDPLSLTRLQKLHPTTVAKGNDAKA